MQPRLCLAFEATRARFDERVASACQRACRSRVTDDPDRQLFGLARVAYPPLFLDAFNDVLDVVGCGAFKEIRGARIGTNAQDSDRRDDDECGRYRRDLETAHFD